MVDYRNQSHNLFFTANVAPTDQLRLHGKVNFNLATAELDQVVMPDVTTREGFDLNHQDFSFDEMHEYSNLDYELLNLSAGVEYLLGEGVTFTADLDYADLTDNAGYVYGIESGSFSTIRTGVRFEF
jgi:hypothetical protein